MSNYVIKSDLKNATGVDTSQFANKGDSDNLQSDVDQLDVDRLEKEPSTKLNSLKSKVDKVDVDKLKYVPVDFENKK